MKLLSYINTCFIMSQVRVFDFYFKDCINKPYKKKRKMDEDILQEIPEGEIPNVLEALKKDWPKHFLLYQCITIMSHYKKSKAESFSQVLYKYGSIDNGVYLLKTSFSDSSFLDKALFIYTTSEDLTQLLKVLMETSRISWKNDRKTLFEITFNEYTPLIEQVGTSKGVPFSTKHDFMLWYPPEKEIEIGNLPDDVSLEYLGHAPEINENWLVKGPGSEEFLRKTINANFGLGLFRKSDKKLLSSSISFHSGGIFALYTDAESRGKGYAEIIVRNMVKEIRLRGRIPFCTILLENQPSQKLFRKIGFQDFSKVDFIFIN